MELEDTRMQAVSRGDARESRGDRSGNNNDNHDEDGRDGADQAGARPNENLLKRQASSTGTNKNDATGAERAPKRRKQSGEESGSNRTGRHHHHRHRHRRHHRQRDAARRREEERVCRQELEKIRSLDQRRSMLLSINEGIRRDNAVVGGIIAAVHHLPNERNPLLQLLLTQHILYETHRYTLKLLQDEVFAALRQELESERPREYILQRLILPDDNDSDDENDASRGTDLDKLVNVLRVLPLDQLIRLLKPPEQA